MLELLDTVGQVDHSVRDEWIRNGDAFLIAYSLTSRLTFKMVKTLHEDVRRVKGNAAPDIPIMIVGNKSDLAPELREVSAEEGAALSHALGVVGFLETSAKNRNNVENAFLDLVTSFVRSFDQAKREEDERILAQERERQARAKRGEKAETSLKNRLSHFILRLKPRF
jgi:GTPase SAR1 family protein